MDCRILYTQRALKDLAEIFGHAAEEEADAASRFGNALLDHVEFLAQFPRMGAIMWKRPRVRKLVHSPILVYYQIHERERLVEILHFRHAARMAPDAELQSEHT